MCEEYKNILIKYLTNAGIYCGNGNWDIIEDSQFGGRCLMANKDFELNEVIFCDKPLFYGPRGSNYEKIFCISCYKTLKKLTLCRNLCRFPLCEECEVNNENHKAECELIRSWKFANNARYSKHLFRALTIIRGILLKPEDENIMFKMASHDNSKIKNIEVEKLLSEFDGITENLIVVDKLKKVSCILNTNAFEMGVLGRNNEEGEIDTISLRGLFPLAALMNHSCIPNIRYTYDNNKIMTCKASKPIKKGEQLFNSYTKVLWGNGQRRMHLYYSKNFLCKCNRCLDPTELGSYISSIKCIRPGCDGKMLAMHPLTLSSPWKCENCNLSLDYSKVSKIHDILSKQIFHKIQNDSMSSNRLYLKEKLPTILPSCNQFTIELKLQIIFKLQKDGFIMNENDFEDICQYSYDILDVLEKLSVGECYIKGILCYELAKAKIQKAKLNATNFNEIEEKIREEVSAKLQTSYTILGNSISEPKDLSYLLNIYSS